MANEEIRQKAKQSRVTFWMIADEMGMAESTFTRLMRHELPEEQKQNILRMIERLSLEDK